MIDFIIFTSALLFDSAFGLVARLCLTLTGSKSQAKCCNMHLDEVCAVPPSSAGDDELMR